MNACQGIRYWSQSSYEETYVHIAGAHVTTTANQQPPPRGEGFLAMKKNPSAHKCEYVWDHLLHHLVPSTGQSQKLVSFKSVLESHQHNMTSILHVSAGNQPQLRKRVFREGLGRNRSSPGPPPLALPTDGKMPTPLKHGLDARAEIFRLQGLQ